MSGFYSAKTSGGDRHPLAKAIEVMEIAAPYYPEAQLATAIAEERARLAALR